MPAHDRPVRATRNKRPSGGFAELACGISLWMVIVACCGLTYMQPILPSGLSAGWYALPQQVGYVATYFVCAAIEWLARPIAAKDFAKGVAATFSCALAAILVCSCLTGPAIF